MKTETYDPLDLDEELGWFARNLSAQTLGPLYGMPAEEFIEWRRDFLYEVFYYDQRSRDGALNRLARLGVPLRPILQTILETLSQVRSPMVQQLPRRTNEVCHRDADLLCRGTLSEKWQVVERWEWYLRQFPAFFEKAFKTIRVLFFETPEGQRGYVIDERIPGSRSFPETKLPQGANETGEGIVTKNYPSRDLYEKLKVTLPHEQTTWLANQIRRIGQGKHGGRLNNEELQECALSLEETIKKYVPRGRRCIREIGELLQAAFPNDFQPKDDLSKATVKLIKRAHKRGVTALPELN